MPTLPVGTLRYIRFADVSWLMGCRMPTPGKSSRRLSDAYPGQSAKRRRFSVSGPPPLFSGEGITYHRIPVVPDGLAWLHGWVICFTVG